MLVLFSNNGEDEVLQKNLPPVESNAQIAVNTVISALRNEPCNFNATFGERSGNVLSLKNSKLVSTRQFIYCITSGEFAFLAKLLVKD